MFSNKGYDYLRFINALFAVAHASHPLYYDDLPKYIRNSEALNTVDYIISAYYFPA